ncbi:tRNA glutamyl-Q(34) synthetase GluQRS [Magnetospirillum sp. J10]|uniref:tRNA glutamyl-Q(34) synthetase GluQRS n=2 Tax=Magnetospirillum sulfuroxidans TaxID=611300 RepID=A0ABS5IDT5_9PROT|nr:tRNA glutamyl-Q(34) synthetase GluQRS [Magnetospirillum sulfuroxidans]
MVDAMITTTRFAPSPTGLLHLGHAYGALFAQDQARRRKGRFLLRLEDIDPGRCRAEFAAAIIDDLRWLGLDWDAPIRRQSEHLEEYRRLLARLAARGLLYPCFCTRKDIEAEIARSGHAPHGPDGALYPGLCRSLSADQRAEKQAAGQTCALRLDMAAAIAQTGTLWWHDHHAGRIAAQPELFGDVVLARKDTPTSYHLAVTWDDALQQVTLVTRGQDLFAATHVHRLLQALLELPTPQYHHHPLRTDSQGRRYAKRDKALTIAALRAAGRSPAEIQALAGFIPLSK